jgi:hypothetical protein
MPCHNVFKALSVLLVPWMLLPIAASGDDVEVQLGAGDSFVVKDSAATERFRVDDAGDLTLSGNLALHGDNDPFDASQRAFSMKWDSAGGYPYRCDSNSGASFDDPCDDDADCTPGSCVQGGTDGTTAPSSTHWAIHTSSNATSAPGAGPNNVWDKIDSTWQFCWNRAEDGNAQLDPTLHDFCPWQFEAEFLNDPSQTQSYVEIHRTFRLAGESNSARAIEEVFNLDARSHSLGIWSGDSDGDGLADGGEYALTVGSPGSIRNSVMIGSSQTPTGAYLEIDDTGDESDTHFYIHLGDQNPGSSAAVIGGDWEHAGAISFWTGFGSALDPSRHYRLWMDLHGTWRTSTRDDHALLRTKITQGAPTNEQNGDPFITGSAVRDASQSDRWGPMLWAISDGDGSCSPGTLASPAPDVTCGEEVCMKLGMTCVDVLEFSQVADATDSDCTTTQAGNTKFFAMCK